MKQYILSWWDTRKKRWVDMNFGANKENAIVCAEKKSVQPNVFVAEVKQIETKIIWGGEEN